MLKIKTTDELQLAIMHLEYKQATEWQALQKQFDDTRERLKPMNLLKDTLREIGESPEAVGSTAGYLAKKIIVGKSENVFRNFIGTVIQNIFASNPEMVKSLTTKLFNAIREYEK
jgi:hypothetical protein